MSRTNANPSAGNAGARQTLSGSSKSATNSRPALSEQDRRRGGRSPRRKGDRGEREIVARHLALNVRRNALSRPRCRCGRVRIGPQECSLVSDANRVRPPAVLCSLNAGLAKTICCFSAAITPSRAACKGAAMSTRQRLPQRRASTTSPLAAALDAIHNSEKANGL